MSTTRKILYHAAGILFKTTLLILPLVFAITFVLSSPASIEKALKESHVYDQFVGIVLDKSQEQAPDPTTKLLLANPGVRAAIEKSFPPQLLESSASSVIKGAFAWLQGKTPEPEFTMDFSEAKTALISNLTAFAQKRTSGLPICTVEQAQTLNPRTDLLSLPCLPPGFDVNQSSQQFSEQLLNDVDFLDKPIITNKTLAKEGQTSLVSGDLQQLPEAYQAAQNAKWLVLVVAFVLAALLIFVRHDRRAGLRHVGWALVGVGVFWTVSLVAYWFMFDKFNQAGASIDSTQAMILDGAQVILADLNRVVAVFVGCYIVIGGTVLVALKLRQPPKPADEPSSEEEPTKPLAPPAAEKPPKPSDKIS